MSRLQHARRALLDVNTSKARSVNPAVGTGGPTTTAQVGTADGPSVLVAYGKQAIAVLCRSIGSGALEGHLLLLSR